MGQIETINQTSRENIKIMSEDLAVNANYRQDAQFYILKLNNDSLDIVFNTNYVGSKIEFVSLSLPLFDNIDYLFESSDIIINGNTYYLNTGLYLSGLDIATSLTALTNPIESVTWAFDSATKRLVASGAANFTITETRLSSLYLGFNGNKAGAATYTSDRLINFFPFSGIILNSNKFPQKITYKDEDGNDQSVSFLFNIDTFDFVSKTTLTIDKNSFYANELYINSRESLFPIKMELDVLFVNGSAYKIPLSDYSTAELVVKIL